MKNLIYKLNLAIHSLRNEHGQDLVEYALVVALIAFAATAGMTTLAKDINDAFTSIGTQLTGAVA
jgi:pilus assembly protein Flp/PilA